VISVNAMPKPGGPRPLKATPAELARHASEVIAALDSRGAWVVHGEKMKHNKGIPPSGIIFSEVFAKNVTALCNALGLGHRAPLSQWKLARPLLAFLTSSLFAVEKVNTPWSFAPLRRPVVPQTQDAWARDDIDRFALSYQAAKGLKPNADASTRDADPACDAGLAMDCCRRRRRSRPLSVILLAMSKPLPPW